MDIRDYNEILKSIEEIRSEIIKEPNSADVNDKYQKINELVVELKSDNYEYDKIALEKIKNERAKSNNKEDFIRLSKHLENKKYYMENKDIIESLPPIYKDEEDLFVLRKLYNRKVDKTAFKVAVVGGVSILALATGIAVINLNKKSKKEEKPTTEITTEFRTEDIKEQESTINNDLKDENTSLNEDDMEVIDLEDNKSKNDKEIDNLLNKWRKEEKTTEKSTESNTNVNTNTNTNNNTNNNTTTTDSNKSSNTKEENKKSNTTKKKDTKKKEDNNNSKETTKTTEQNTEVKTEYTRTEVEIVPEVTTEAPKIIESTEAEVRTTEMNEEEVRKLFEKVTTEEKKEKKTTEEKENTYDIDEKDINYHSEALEIKSEKSKGKVLVYFNI